MFCFGIKEERKPWKWLASTIRKKIRNLKKQKESPTTNQRLKHYEHFRESYYQLKYDDHRHHSGRQPPAEVRNGDRAYPINKSDQVHSSLIKSSQECIEKFNHGRYELDLFKEVDVKAEEFIRNMKKSWSLENQQSRFTNKFDRVDLNLIKLNRECIEKFDHVRSGLFEAGRGRMDLKRNDIYGRYELDQFKEVDVKAEEFIKNMKISWSLEKQQSSDSINSVN